jgi:hypothetical protein
VDTGDGGDDDDDE